MSSTLRTLLLAALAAAVASAVPVIGPPVNQGSFASPDEPMYGIAQGSMFAIFGTEMGPDTLVVASAFPLTAELAGTSAQVSIGGETLDCIMVFTSAGQIAAILPSATPLGDGEITVTYNGVTSAPQPIRVVANGVGMFTIPQNGRGPSVVTDANYAVNTYLNSFAPGAVAIAWVTGLGARTADDRAVPEDLKERYNVEVGVGGVSAKVIYAGPSGCCAGVDQIVYEVPSLPEEVRTGCHVPLVVRAGGTLSNFTSMSVSSDGPVCSDPHGLSAEEVTRLHEQGELRIVNVAATAFSATAGPALGGGAAAALLPEKAQDPEPNYFVDAKAELVQLAEFFEFGPPALETCAVRRLGNGFVLESNLSAQVLLWADGVPFEPLEGSLDDFFFQVATNPDRLDLELNTVPPLFASYDINSGGGNPDPILNPLLGQYQQAIDAGLVNGDWVPLGDRMSDPPPRTVTTFGANLYHGHNGRLGVQQFFCTQATLDPLTSQWYEAIVARQIAADTLVTTSLLHDKTAFPSGSAFDLANLNIQRTAARLFAIAPGPVRTATAQSAPSTDGQFLSVSLNIHNVAFSLAAEYSAPGAEGWGLYLQGQGEPWIWGALEQDGSVSATRTIHDLPEGGPTMQGMIQAIENEQVLFKILGPEQSKLLGGRLRFP